MKKILISSLLGSALAFNLAYGKELSQVTNQYLDFLRLAEGNPCDIPDSEQCFNDAQEACNGDGVCMRYFIMSNNTANYQSEYADGAKKFVDEIFKGYFTEQKQKNFNAFLQEYKNRGYKIENFLLDKQIDDKTNIEYISGQNLIQVATEIRNVFGSLQNNQAINEYVKNNKIEDNIKKILFE